MKVDGRHFRSIWLEADGWSVGAIDQRRLPHEFVMARIESVDAAAEAIRAMLVRGAPLIGATAAYGIALAMRADPSDSALDQACTMLIATRPTAVNLKWALDEMQRAVRPLPPAARAAAAYARADEIAEQDVAINREIGRHGLALIEAIGANSRRGEPVNILTHCNAGWLATVDFGTATAPIYLAHDSGLAVHVWVDETRPRNQGASLTAWELGHHGVPHTVIPDNTGGHLMQHGRVDLAIVGTDRVAANGDVCNKIGTYLKALAAHDNRVPFYVALPSPTIDFAIDDGVRQIPIEQRSAEEVATMTGRTADGRIETVRVVPEGSPIANYGFDVTPARLVTGLITERGVLKPERAALAGAFPERIAAHQSRLGRRSVDASDSGAVSSLIGARLSSDNYPDCPATVASSRSTRKASSMSSSELEIVVDDPTAPEPDSPAVTDTRVVEIVASLLLLGLAVLLGYDNWRTGIGWDSTGPQAGYFPFYLSVILGGASLYGLVAAAMTRKQEAETFVTRAQLRRVMAVFVPTLLFCLATQFLGLYVASFLLIAGFMRLVGRIALWKSLLTAFIFTAAMFVTFDIAFDVIMPKGPLEAAFGY